MTSESILLISRETRNAHEVLETHANRLSRRAIADDVTVATYESEPVSELRGAFEQVPGDAVYVVPMVTAHTHDTINSIPAALSYLPGDVHYCEPPGQSPAVTGVIAERGAEMVPASEDASLVLVGFGSSSKPYQRQTTEYHAARLRGQSGYGQVLTCYLLQNPAIECVRYNAVKDRLVAVPLFLSRTEATEVQIPNELELERGDIKYADPFGEHPGITDAVHAEVGKQRALAFDDSASAASFESRLARTRRPIATDGEGKQH